MIHHMQQHTPEWYAMRSGKITSSRIVDLLKYLAKGGESQKRIDYRLDLVAERLTGICEDCFIFKQEDGTEVRRLPRDMQWGEDNEPFARARYEMVTGSMVEQVGFITHPTMPFAGGSPDGLVDADGVIELKCPKTTTHLEWMSAGVLPPEHEPQCMFNIACSEREWCDFASFDPRIPEVGLRLFKVRLYRNEQRIADLEAEARRFNDSIEELLHKLRKGNYA